MTNDTDTATRAEADTGPGEATGATSLPFDAQPIATERLVLRPLSADDFDDVNEYRRRRAPVVRYLHWEVHDHEESERRLRRHMTMTRLAREGDSLIYAVELVRDDGRRVVGDVSVFLKSARHAQFELGWVFHPAVHGRGYATEASHALLALCFDTLGAHRVFAELDVRNEASARLCELLGMRKEAVLRETEARDGEWHDTAIYALLHEEYAEAVTVSSGAAC